jgi:hypothetical protein
MKKLLGGVLAILLWGVVAPTYAQGSPAVDYATISEIIALYRDGQYAVVKAKLANQGFTQTSAEPDYTLHGQTHRGVFTMTYETDSPSADYRRMGIKEKSTWEFSTEIDERVRVTDVVFHLPTSLSQAKYVYTTLVGVWRNAQLEQSTMTCGTAVDCVHLQGAINGAPRGYQDYAWLAYDVANAEIPEASGGTVAIIALNGNLTYRRVKQISAVAKAKTVPKTKRRATITH